MRKGRPLTPAEEKAQAEYEAWHEARMQDLAEKAKLREKFDEEWDAAQRLEELAFETKRDEAWNALLAEHGYGPKGGAT